MDTVTLDIHNGPITGTAQVSTDGFREGQWKVSKEDKALEIDNCQIHSAVVGAEGDCGRDPLSDVHGSSRTRTPTPPRGGLPRLRSELVELATLLYVDVEDKDTVEKLKAKVSPVIDMIKGDKTRSALEIAQGIGRRTPRRKPQPQRQQRYQALIRAQVDVKDLRRRRIHFDHAELVL